jgi:hypothetical protein
VTEVRLPAALPVTLVSESVTTKYGPATSLRNAFLSHITFLSYVFIYIYIYAFIYNFFYSGNHFVVSSINL